MQYENQKRYPHPRKMPKIEDQQHRRRRQIRSRGSTQEIQFLITKVNFKTKRFLELLCLKLFEIPIMYRPHIQIFEHLGAPLPKVIRKCEDFNKSHLRRKHLLD